jgi:hypothetical protein
MCRRFASLAKQDMVVNGLNQAVNVIGWQSPFLCASIPEPFSTCQNNRRIGNCPFTEIIRFLMKS